MASVNITLSDTDEDGGVAFRVDFDPPVEDTDIMLTPAQAEGAFIMEVMARRAQGESLSQIAAEMDEDEYGLVVGGYEPVDKEPESGGNN
jgi:hypothetical protein